MLGVYLQLSIGCSRPVVLGKLQSSASGILLACGGFLYLSLLPGRLCWVLMLGGNVTGIGLLIDAMVGFAWSFR